MANIILGKAYGKTVQIVVNPTNSNAAAISLQVDAGNSATKNITAASGGGGAGVWGAITGTLTDQSDLNTALAAKATTASVALKAPLASPTFSGTVTGTFSGNITGNVTGNCTGSAGSVTTNANLTGPVTSVGNATAIANSAITNAMLANSAVANLSGTNTGDQTTVSGSSGSCTGNSVTATTAHNIDSTALAQVGAWCAVGFL